LSLTIREERRLRVFENRILRLIYESRRGENKKCGRLYNGEHHSLYRSPSIVKVIKFRRERWRGHVARTEEAGSPFKILTGKPTGNINLRRLMRGWKGSIRMDLKEI
jgi:hypothetical protein